MNHQILKLILLLNVTIFCQKGFAGVKKNDFESKYPTHCFAMDSNKNLSDDSRDCRASRLNFYLDYMSREPANLKIGNLNKFYSMIKVRASIENGWSNF